MTRIIEKYLKYADIPHTSRYHKESFIQHVCAVTGLALRETNDTIVWRAAAIHDILKPETVKVRNGAATFYNHELVDVDITREFVKGSEEDLLLITNLVRAHMLHYHMHAPAPFGIEAKERLHQLCKDESFKRQLMILSFCDETGSARNKKDIDFHFDTLVISGRAFLENEQFFV